MIAISLHINVHVVLSTINPLKRHTGDTWRKFVLLIRSSGEGVEVNSQAFSLRPKLVVLLRKMPLHDRRNSDT